MTGDFHAILPCVAVWRTENRYKSFIDDVLMLGHCIMLYKAGIVDGVG
jgi:hypothetical protein